MCFRIRVQLGLQTLEIKRGSPLIGEFFVPKVFFVTNKSDLGIFNLHIEID